MIRRIDKPRQISRLFLVTGTVAALFGLVESCDDRLLGITRYVDPCGTFLANCTPGTFETQAADIGDYCIDPTCTVPGGCDNGQPLGTITRLCP